MTTNDQRHQARRKDDQHPDVALDWTDADLNKTDDPSAAEDIRVRMQDELIERVRVMLRRMSAAGLRMQIPDTDIIILAGNHDWLAKQVGKQESAETIEKRASALNLCLAVAATDMAKSVLVDDGRTTLRDFLIDLASVIDCDHQ